MTDEDDEPPCMDCDHEQREHDMSGGGCHPCRCGCPCYFPSID